MSKVIPIIQLVLVNYFYRVNSGLFIFIFFVLFGLPYSPLAFHYSLITGIVQSQFFLLLVVLSWLLYNLKCIDYILKQIENKQDSFLFVLNCLPFRKNYLYQLYVQVLVYLPVLIYSLAIVWIALKKNEYLSAAEIVLFNMIILFVTPLVYVKALQRRLPESLFNFPILQLKVPKPFFLFPIYFLLYNRKQMVFLTKLFSLLFVYGFIELYEPERYDLRPIQLCLLLLAAAHATIVYEIRVFEIEYLAFAKNLPLTIVGRFFRMITMLVLLLLPEFIILLKGTATQFGLPDYPQLLLMAIALLMMFYVVLLLEKTSMEQFIRTVFGIIAACFFIILYDPGIGLAMALLGLAFVLYHSYYYHAEH